MDKILLGFCLVIFSAANTFAQEAGDAAGSSPIYQYEETQALASLVKAAANLIETKGEAVFPGFKEEGSRWRHGDIYIFILDTKGNMILHPDPVLEGANQIGLKDVNNRPIIKGLIDAATGAKKEGWFHYQWPEPGSFFPLWKSSFVKQAVSPSGKKYVVGSGVYNMKMEKQFIVEVVDSAAALIEKEGKQAFPKIRDKAGAFMFLDTYVFVDSPDGVELVNGAFPNIEGRNLIGYKDSTEKYLVRDYINTALNNGAGWVDYLWPKPGQTEPSKKHTYVRKAKYGEETFIVGSGAYLD
ncbi:MAG: cache domain-containing protein [Candidatus Omnitrophica bacterium]|nr:cache domain-containing protein [Candidatus Omnitrophota bacterium]